MASSVPQNAKGPSASPPGSPQRLSSLPRGVPFVAVEDSYAGNLVATLGALGGAGLGPHHER